MGDIIGAGQALIAFFVANFSQVEALAKRLAEDVAAVYALALALSAVLAPFFGKAQTAKVKLLNAFNPWSSEKEKTPVQGRGKGK